MDDDVLSARPTSSSSVARPGRFRSWVTYLLSSILAGASGGLVVTSLDRRSEAEQGEVTARPERVTVKQHTRDRPSRR